MSVVPTQQRERRAAMLHLVCDSQGDPKHNQSDVIDVSNKGAMSRLIRTVQYAKP